MNDVNVNRFEFIWKTFQTNAESLHLYQAEVEWIIRYTGERLTALSDYLGSVRSPREQKKLSFYVEYVDLLQLHQMHLNFQALDDSRLMLFLYLYSELLLGSGRYLNIRQEMENNS
jgi:hypothetical protein